MTLYYCSEKNVFCMCDLFVETVCSCGANVPSVTTDIESEDAVNADKVSQGPTASSENIETLNCDHFVPHQTADPSSNGQDQSVTDESMKCTLCFYYLLLLFHSSAFTAFII